MFLSVIDDALVQNEGNGTIYSQKKKKHLVAHKTFLVKNLFV